MNMTTRHKPLIELVRKALEERDGCTWSWERLAGQVFGVTRATVDNWRKKRKRGPRKQHVEKMMEIIRQHRPDLLDAYDKEDRP